MSSPPNQKEGLVLSRKETIGKKNSKCSPWLGTMLTFYLHHLNLIFANIFERCYFYQIHSAAGETKPEFLHQ